MVNAVFWQGYAKLPKHGVLLEQEQFQEAIFVALVQAIPGAVDYGVCQLLADGVKSRYSMPMRDRMRLFWMRPEDEEQPTLVIGYEPIDDFIDREALQWYPNTDPDSVTWEWIPLPPVSNRPEWVAQLVPLFQAQLSQWQAQHMQQATPEVQASGGARRL